MEKNCIKIKDMVNMAITEEQGLKLRKKSVKLSKTKMR